MNEKNHATLAHKTVFFGGIILAAILSWNFLWAAMLPFFLAWIVSLPIRRLAAKLSKKTALPYKFCAVICLVLILTALLFLLKLGVSSLVGEILALYDKLTQDPELILEFFDGVSDKLDSAGGIFSIFDKLSESEDFLSITQSLEVFFSDAISRVVYSLGQKISGAAVNVASKIPGVLFFFAAFLTSCFYFSCDSEKISGFFINLLPKEAREKLPKLKQSIKDIVLGYVKATILLCGMTFFVVIVGLLCIGCRYAILLSVLIALIDMLPVLGSGVILLPWSLICFLGSDIKRGVALLIIWAVATVARQVAEPRLLGKSIGLHPLATLVSVYAGAQLLGFAGIIAGPLVAVGIKAFLPILTGEKDK